MKKVSTILLCLLMSIPLLNAQSIIQKVNDIKLSDDYIWHQYAHPNADTALVKATDWLLGVIMVGKAKEEREQISAQDLLPYVKHIYLKGKEVIRAFVYMKKEDIAPALTAIRNKGNAQIQEIETSFTPSPMVQEIMNLKDIYATKEYLDTSIRNGVIERYGSLKETENINDKYLILFSQEDLRPFSVLSPMTDGKRMNLYNGKDDSLDNHHGCYAIWYILKEKR